MATAAKIESSKREAHAKSRIFQGASSNTRINLNSTAGTLVALDGEEVVIPSGCEVLELQPRLCGDWYAEIKGPKAFVAGFGATSVEAAKAAIAKVPA